MSEHTAMFREDLSKEHLPIVPPPVEVFDQPDRNFRKPDPQQQSINSNSSDDSSRKNSVKRKPVGSAPSLPKLDLSDNNSTENLTSSLDSNNKRLSSPRGPREAPPSSISKNDSETKHPSSEQQPAETPSPTLGPPIQPKQPPPKRKPVGGGPSSIEEGIDSNNTIENPPTLPPRPPPKEYNSIQSRYEDRRKSSSPKRSNAQTMNRLSAQFADFPGVKAALEGNPLAAQISPPRKKSPSNDHNTPEDSNENNEDDDDVDDDDDDDDDESFERREIASGTIKGKKFQEPLDSSAKNDDQVKYWKYHVLKYSKDLYLTTNPDHNHLSRPVAPSYYVDTTSSHDPCKLVFNSMEQGVPEMTIEKRGNAFNLSVNSEEEGLVWTESAIETQTTVTIPGAKRPVKCRQYTFRDDYGVEWVIGNRIEHTTTYDASGHPFGSYSKVSSKVYFFIRGEDEDSDIILAVLRRRHPKRKRMFKQSLTKWIDEGGHLLNSYHHNSNTNNTTNKDNTTMHSNQSASSELKDDDADNEKIGWLYMLDSIVVQQSYKKQPYLWKIVTAFTLAVSYSLRMEEKDRSFHQRLSNFKRKAIQSVQQ